MKPNYPQLAQRLFNTPLAITPGKIEIIMAAMADRFGLAKVFRMDGSSVSMDGYDMREQASSTPYQVINGVALIPVHGTLVQKLGTMQPYSGMTGYDGLRANLSMALEDEQVKAIAFDIDSPGGEVAGCFDFADAIYRSRGIKPMWSILSESAYSAAYAIASATDRICVPRTGGVGSVGVICAHIDMSKALDKEGMTVTVIHYGEHKADGSEYKPLSSGALSRFQKDVDAMGDLFVKTVARNRGLSFEQVKNTEASTFMGADGVRVGFADDVMSPDEAFTTLLNQLG